LKTDQRKNRVV